MYPLKGLAVWHPKTKATRTLKNDVIWRKSTFNTSMLTSFQAICLRKKTLLIRYLVLSPQPVYKSEQANSPSSHSGKEKRWFFALGKMTIGMTSLKFSGPNILESWDWLVHQPWVSGWHVIHYQLITKMLYLHIKKHILQAHFILPVQFPFLT